VRHLAEILYDHTYKDVVERHMSKLEQEVEFCRQGALFQIQFMGHISTISEDNFYQIPCVGRKWDFPIKNLPPDSRSEV